MSKWLMLILKSISIIIISFLFIASSFAKDLNTIYIQKANGSHLAPVNSTGGIYDLTLKGVSPYVASITDRSIHKTGLISTSSFLEKWHQKDKAHEAIITFYNKNGEQVNIAVTLSNPVYNFKLKEIQYRANISSKQSLKEITDKANSKGYTVIFNNL